MPAASAGFDFKYFWDRRTEPYYPGPVKVQFAQNDETEDGLHVVIDTPQLELTAFTPQDKKFYHGLMSNEKATALFGSGNALTRAETDARSDRHISRWQSGIPLSGFIMSLREVENNSVRAGNITSSNRADEEGRIGFAVLGYGGSYIRNTAQNAIIIQPDFWNAGYGKEALWALSNPYAYELKSKGLFVGYGEDKTPLIGIESTVDPKNVCSMSVVLGSGADLQYTTSDMQWPIGASDLSACHQLPQPIVNGVGQSRYLFFQPVKHFSAGQPELSKEALLPNVARLVGKM